MAVFAQCLAVARRGNMYCVVFLVTLAAIALGCRCEQPAPECAVPARTTAGWVCGARRRDARGQLYASFRGVPYAKQPLGELRFKELEPPEPWSETLDATVEGPICPQTDIFYGPLMKPMGMSEKCIHANIHVPFHALPRISQRLARDLKTPLAEARDIPNPDAIKNATSLPILVFIHGGGFAFGSGDADLYGPENLVSNGVIVITFNYRLNVFGFLSLNTTKIPGNNGLRDMITLLRWVRDNARNFGGNPDDVTVGGQSAGACAAHLLTLSLQAQGLFKKAILMSGTAIPSFYTTTPAYAGFISNAFLTALGIDTEDLDEAHRSLVEMPLDKIMAVNKAIQDQGGLGAFFPVIESPKPGVKSILPEDTEVLLEQGYGEDIPLLIGFTNAECESFRKRFEEIDILTRIDNNPLMMMSPTVTFSVPPDFAFTKAKMIEKRYFMGTPTIDKFLKACSAQYFEYPALKLAHYRSINGGTTFVYQFSYDAFYSPLKQALGLNFSGAGHVEDLTYVFQVNSVSVAPNDWDEAMKKIMTEYVTNFIRFGHPTNNGYNSWKPLDRDGVRYEVLHSPTVHHLADRTHEQRSMEDFFDGIFERS